MKKQQGLSQARSLTTGYYLQKFLLRKQRKVRKIWHVNGSIYKVDINKLKNRFLVSIIVSELIFVSKVDVVCANSINSYAIVGCIYVLMWVFVCLAREHWTGEVSAEKWVPVFPVFLIGCQYYDK